MEANGCGLLDLAQQLCWRQFDLFQATTPLTAKTAKLALQPIVNLGRLSTRDGDRRPRVPDLRECLRRGANQSGHGEIDSRDIDMLDDSSTPDPRRVVLVKHGEGR
ncbi:MAG: hypothetical protein ACRDRU_23605 [Pseudonocardiaceae bacterium]